MRDALIQRLIRQAVLLALLSVLSGAFLTSETMSAGPLAPPGLHRVSGAVTLILVLVIVCGVFSSPSLRRLRALAAGCFALCLAAGATFAVPAVHALVSQVVVAALICLAVLTAPWRDDAVQQLKPARHSRLRVLSLLTVLALLLQVVLGVGYRHKLLGLAPHVAGALLSAGAVLVLSLYIMQTFPAYRGLRSAASIAAAVTVVQFLLGAVAFVMWLLGADTRLPAVLAVVAHVFTGALMLAAATLLAIQIGRRVSADGA